MTKISFLLTACALGAVPAVGCVRHIYPADQKVRTYKPAAYAAPDAEQTEGSLWSEGSVGMFEDARARRVGDILTVEVEERSDASRDAATRTARSSSTSLGISAFFSAMQKLVSANPGVDPMALVGAASEAEFDGAGTTKRSGELRATLPVRIRERLPNGDFFVEGTKVVLLNDEESHLYLSGVVRPIDLEPNNTISSERLADVELEYTGRGVLSERQSPGWLSRTLDYLWPF